MRFLMLLACVGLLFRLTMVTEHLKHVLERGCSASSAAPAPHRPTSTPARIAEPSPTGWEEAPGGRPETN
jgi:hypothetical protein